jgi:hypothetical protein
MVRIFCFVSKEEITLLKIFSAFSAIILAEKVLSLENKISKCSVESTFTCRGFRIMLAETEEEKTTSKNKKMRCFFKFLFTESL